MQTLSDKQRAIAASPLFRYCTPRELARVDERSHLVTVPIGRAVLEENGRPSAAYVIVEGEAEVLFGDQRVVTVSVGEPLGEAGVLTGERRQATVRAVTDMTLLEFEARDFVSLIDSTGSLGLGLLERLAARQSKAQNEKLRPVVLS